MPFTEFGYRKLQEIAQAMPRCTVETPAPQSDEAKMWLHPTSRWIAINTWKCDICGYVDDNDN